MGSRSSRDPVRLRRGVRASLAQLASRAEAGDRDAAHVLVDATAEAGEAALAEMLALALAGRERFDVEDNWGNVTVVRGAPVPADRQAEEVSRAIGNIRHALVTPAEPRGVRMPSAARLVAAFRDIDRPTANLMRRIAHAADEPDELAKLIERVPETAAYVRSMYSDPYASGMWRCRTVVLHALDQLLGTGGVEALGPVHMRRGPPYEYLNAGDPYVATLIYNRDADAITIGSWGDIVERHPGLDREDE